MTERPRTDDFRDFLLEVGTEEIPARFMPPLLAQLEQKAAGLLKELRLDYADLAACGAPRRFALMVRALATRQPDQTVASRGPAAAVAFDAAGRPTRAAEGFARSQGLAVDQLERRTVDGKEYLFAVRREEGRSAAELLAGALPQFITGLEFPKTMRWGDRSLRFVRPIRWLVALLGDQVVPFTIEDIVAGRDSRGHRTLSNGPVTIGTAAGYLDGLRQARVIADQNERRAMVAARVREAARAHAGNAVIDDDLLEEVTFMVEYPTPFVGMFDPAFLDVPPEVIITTMKVHQRYFPLVDAAGALMPMFVGVRDGGEGGLDTVRSGNDKVLRARLAHARFFLDEERQRPLAARGEALRRIVFQERLGTLFDKTQRIRTLTGAVARMIGLDDDATRVADRAALLAKADLTTTMVREFPELQGVMGREYAIRSGELPDVATAIAEHYLPRGAADAPATSGAGRAVALADRLDTLAGCFAIGLVPTGSADPYGLRRAAIGILSTLFAGDYRVSLRQLIDLALAGLRGHAETAADLANVDTDVVTAAILDFFRGRLKVILADRGYAADTIDAVLAVAGDDPVDATRRCDQLERLRQLPAFADVSAAYGRVASLAGKAESADYDRSALREPVEARLIEALTAAARAAEAHRQAGDYLLAWQELAALRPAIYDFFNGVMVMAEDQRVRASRLGLVRAIADQFTALADLGRLSF
ncbi:MAG: glycine--tRNA ligase subunit beta [Chloroflexota bacterium]